MDENYDRLLESFRLGEHTHYEANTSKNRLEPEYPSPAKPTHIHPAANKRGHSRTSEGTHGKTSHNFTSEGRVNDVGHNGTDNKVSKL